MLTTGHFNTALVPAGLFGKGEHTGTANSCDVQLQKAGRKKQPDTHYAQIAGI
jgi:hypothetical protein